MQNDLAGSHLAQLHGKVFVNVKTNAASTHILNYDEASNTLHIAIAAPPQDNKANKELIKFLSKLLKKKVSLKSGFTSKKKIIIID